MKNYPYHYEEATIVQTSPAELFAYADNPQRFSSHMSESSWMMGGGKMQVTTDEGHGQTVGSHIRLDGAAFGMHMSLDEVVVTHRPPSLKEWETVGIPKLLIIGNYKMAIRIEPKNNVSLMHVSIDYEYPDKNVWLAKLFGKIYAKWCVRQMLQGANNQFSQTKG